MRPRHAIKQLSHSEHNKLCKQMQHVQNPTRIGRLRNHGRKPNPTTLRVLGTNTHQTHFRITLNPTADTTTSTIPTIRQHAKNNIPEQNKTNLTNQPTRIGQTWKIRKRYATPILPTARLHVGSISQIRRKKYGSLRRILSTHPIPESIQATPNWKTKLQPTTRFQIPDTGI